jgi:hypothetical protein
MILLFLFLSQQGCVTNQNSWNDQKGSHTNYLDFLDQKGHHLLLLTFLEKKEQNNYSLLFLWLVSFHKWLINLVVPNMIFLNFFLSQLGCVTNWNSWYYQKGSYMNFILFRNKRDTTYCFLLFLEKGNIVNYSILFLSLISFHKWIINFIVPILFSWFLFFPNKVV